MSDKAKFFSNGMAGKPFRTNPRLIRSGIASSDFGETTPFIFNNRLLLACVGLPWSRGKALDDLYLWILDAADHSILAQFGKGYGFSSAYAENGRVTIFTAKTDPESNGAKKIESFTSTDLKNWDHHTVLEALPGEELFNESVCRADGRYIMAFEARDDKYPPFTLYFAESQDLINWRRIPNTVYGVDRYTACPAVRYVAGWYYLFFLEHRTPRWWFEMCLTRSRDLIHWQDSPKNPVLDPEDVELCNASDLDLVEFNGKVYAYYLYSNQRGMGSATWAEFQGSLKDFVEYYY